MAADLHIHILDGVAAEDLAIFFRNTMGSKHFEPLAFLQRPTIPEQHEKEQAWQRVMHSPSVWIGEVSWLKAAVFGDTETFIPSTVQQIAALIGEELPVLTDELIQQILSTFDAPNVTGYTLANRSEVEIFLRQYIGKQVFTVSW